jgi:hypothetical protein
MALEYPEFYIKLNSLLNFLFLSMMIFLKNDLRLFIIEIKASKNIYVSTQLRADLYVLVKPTYRCQTSEHSTEPELMDHTSPGRESVNLQFRWNSGSQVLRSLRGRRRGRGGLGTPALLPLSAVWILCPYAAVWGRAMSILLILADFLPDILDSGSRWADLTVIGPA